MVSRKIKPKGVRKFKMSYAKEVNAKFINDDDYPLYPTDMTNVVLRLEVTNVCNHACQFCPNRKLERKRCFLEKDLGMRIIKEAADMGIKRGGFFIMGEPFLNADTLDYYRYARDLGFDFLFLTTNGSLATEEKIIEAFEAGVKSLKFSINGGSPDTYEKIHGKRDYDKAMSALKFARKYRDEHSIDCRILSSFIVTKENAHEIKQHYQNIKDYVDDFAFFGMATYASAVLNETNEIKTDFDSENVAHVEFNTYCPCALLHNTVNVTCEGFLTLCVTDPTNMAAIEDLHTMSLKDAWYSERMTAIRKMHKEQHIEGTLCDNCVNRKLNKVEPFNKELYLRSLAKS